MRYAQKDSENELASQRELKVHLCDAIRDILFALEFEWDEDRARKIEDAEKHIAAAKALCA